MPRSVLRQPSAFPIAADVPQSDTADRCWATSGGRNVPSSSAIATSAAAASNGGAKSNSLPRRQAGRTIRWRNDVEGSGAVASDVRHSVPLADYVEYDAMGDVMPTPMPLMPVYSTIRRPRQTKTVDDVFSRAEYQAWSVQPPPSFIDPSSVYGQPGSFGGPFQPPISDSRSDRSSYRQAGYQQTPGAAFFGPQPQQQRYAMEEDEEAARDRFFAQEMMNTVVGRAPPPPGATVPPSAVQASMQPRLPPRTLKSRSSSLPPRGVLNEILRHGTPKATATRVDVSPLPNRRLPLKLAQNRRLLDAATADTLFDPGIYLQSSPFDMQTGRRMVAPPISTLTGMLMVQIIEGRNLKARDCRHRDSENAEILEMYCVIEIDSEHRARTEVSSIETHFKWNETFEIDVCECRSAEFYIYSWHPQFRHKLKHRACLLLAETLLINDAVGGPNAACGSVVTATAVSDLTGLLIAPRIQSFCLSLEPKGQLLVRLAFHRMMLVFRRHLAIRRQAYWGVPLTNIVDRENIPEYSVPLLLKRMIEEVERRGVDTGGLYTLCGSADKKNALKAALEHDPAKADLDPDAVPDVNLITSLVKDFLRELPEPLIAPATYQTLVEAWNVCLADDREGNAKLVFGVLDCLPRVNKCTLMVVVDHLKYLLSQSPHNGLHQAKLGSIFGPLMFCTSNQRPQVSNTSSPAIVIDFLDHCLAARLLEVVLDLWPSRTSSSDSSGSENSTINLTSNGNRSLVDLWLQENRVPESNC
uniref:Rho-GAP domain-containing protein n=1 Tax=Romanomermis culicivorax TaxID=13658 RepID=A0A915JU68_ROMCU